MNFRLLARILGLLLLLMAASMIGCLAYAVYDDEPYYAADRALGLSSVITAGAGGLLVWLGRGAGRDILRKEAIAIVGLGWTLSAVFVRFLCVLTPSLPPTAALRVRIRVHHDRRARHERY